MFCTQKLTICVVLNQDIIYQGCHLPLQKRTKLTEARRQYVSRIFLLSDWRISYGTEPSHWSKDAKLPDYHSSFFQNKQ